jgi:hypothetical protein
MRDWAVACLMSYGHDPREIREYAWRDIELLLTVAPLLDQRGGLGFGDDG